MAQGHTMNNHPGRVMLSVAKHDTSEVAF